MAEQDFNFETEFSLLDIGATTSMLHAGALRTTMFVYTASAGVEAIALNWDEKSGVSSAMEEARKFARDIQPAAYALVAHLARSQNNLIYLQPDDALPPGATEALQLSMFAADGAARCVTYPVKRSGGNISFGMPSVTDSESTDWVPLGDIWHNPFCINDIVRFRRGERALDPNGPLWHAIVELTRMRIHDDQPHAEEYMSFLDDLRNGVFLVAGRTPDSTARVILRPRTHFNPLGSVDVDASRLVSAEPAPADTEKVISS